MKADSSAAYDIPSRVKSYDSDMDIMHPLRGKMIDIALEVLPFGRAEPITVLDLGIGTGIFTQRMLEHFPQANVLAVDGAETMQELAKSRLGPLAQRVQWKIVDFQSLSEIDLKPNSLDVVISSYAFHHLNREEKLRLLQVVVAATKPQGWIFNADIVVAESAVVEARIQEIRVNAVTNRAPADDDRFRDFAATRQFLDNVEAADQDQPLTLQVDLEILREAGLATAEVFWKEHREAVIGGPKL